MISSTMPSTKYSCSGSPLMFWNGNTAIDGLSGSGGSVPGRGTTGPGAVAESPDLRLRFRQGRRHQTAERGGRHIAVEAGAISGLVSSPLAEAQPQIGTL